LRDTALAVIEESGSRHPTGRGAIIEITDQPHTGCAKFSQRFGTDAHRFVNSEVGKELRLRGVNARVVVPATIRPGDVIRKL
jgi:MOSC domain-containing protein YiiM